ncbi:MAG: hypothetical protein L0229_30155 [Blastocatellia bacterium]|nr:hypothetical protein [Blastocatellia bacterium]
MALPISTSLAVSAVKALLQFRQQVDTILSLNEAAAALPFALPPVPTDDAPHLNDMLDFFKSDQGGMILQLRGLQDDFATVLNDPTSTSPAVTGARSRVFRLYYEAAGVQPTFLGPVDPQAQSKAIQGLSTPEMRLAYYAVESQRLSRNTALVRVLLVTADTLLEFAGENANLFISNPQTRSLVENLIEEFAGKRDFDTEGIETIFKSLLGSTLLAFANNPGDLANKPALKALFAALGDVRDSLGNDFVAGIISVDGFEQLIAAYATEVAGDPSFLTKSDLAQQVLTATLTEIGKNFKQIVDDPKALLGVLEVGIGAASANVAGLLQRDLGGEPLLSAVLSGVLKEVAALSQTDQLFASIADGRIIPDIYKTTLEAIAANPIEFANQNDVEKFVSDLIAGLAGALSQQEVARLFTTDTLKLLASESLSVLASDPQFIAGNNRFATRLLAAVFEASATAVSDGLRVDDLIDIATAAIRAASDNLALLDLNDQVAAAITSIGDAIAASGLGQLANAQGRKAVLLSALRAVAANPTVWGRLQAKDLIQPLVQAILQGIATDPTRLLSGPALVDSVSRILLAAMRRGQQLINQSVSSDDLKKLLTMALERANQEVGKKIDGETLPVFLQRVVSAFLDAPFKLTDGVAADFKQLMDTALAGLD